MLRHAVIACAFIFAAGAAAQTPVPTPVPTTPTTDPMTPGSGPRGMEAHENAGNLSTRDELERLKHQRDLKDGKPSSSGAGGVAADAGDLAPGSAVRDKRGKLVGTIEAIEADGAIVATAAGKVKVPLDAFGKNKKGLLLGITKAEFDAIVAAAVAQPAG